MRCECGVNWACMLDVIVMYTLMIQPRVDSLWPRFLSLLELFGLFSTSEKLEPYEIFTL